MIRETSAGFVLFNGDKILLLHYPQGHWDFPKGGIEKGESDEQAARRELMEETGIRTIRILPGFREVVTYRYKKAGVPAQKDVIFFLAETKEERVRLSHEHVGYVWLSYVQAIEKLTFENARGLLRKAHTARSQSL